MDKETKFQSPGEQVREADDDWSVDKETVSESRRVGQENMRVSQWTKKQNFRVQDSRSENLMMIGQWTMKHTQFQCLEE